MAALAGASILQRVASDPERQAGGNAEGGSASKKNHSGSGDNNG
ncbi:MAG: hypothetical protein JWR69_2808 [Pedosphaera sp.]|nr:hypothetical protein [Pedosphaera sp.]